MNIIKNIKNWYKYRFINELKFLKVLNSPFKGLKLNWYFGEIKHGTPYFLPRKWVKATPELACEAAEKQMQADKKFNEQNPKYARKIKSFEEIYEDKMKCQFPIPIKYFGIHFNSLGWKTKWDEYRFEWSPMISIVIFGKQLVITILPNVKYDKFTMILTCYWESWLNWEYNTNKTKSNEERFKELISKHSNNWTSGFGDSKIVTDYYPLILRNKYCKLYEQILENKQSNN